MGKTDMMGHKRNTRFTRNQVNWLSTLIIGASIVLSAAALAVGLYLFRSNREHTIVATGSANIDFSSDLVNWKGSIWAEAPTSTAAYAKVQNDMEMVRKFLVENGITEDEMRFNAVRITEKTHNNYDENGNYVGEESDGFRLVQDLQVASDDLDKVEKVSREVSTLLEKGIQFNSYGCEYYYTGINELKLDLIESATEHARDRIMIMSKVSGAKLGRLKNSSLGVFQITAINSGTGEYSYDGSFNTSSREKTATVTVKLEYDLK